MKNKKTRYVIRKRITSSSFKDIKDLYNEGHKEAVFLKRFSNTYKKSVPFYTHINTEMYSFHKNTYNKQRNKERRGRFLKLEDLF